MELQGALRKLEAAGTAQNRKVYARHGVQGPCFGVSYADLGKLEKEIGVDHGLALALWKSGNHDARVLATRIADPARVTPRLLEDWAGEVSNHVLQDALVGLASRTEAVQDRIEAWTDAQEEWRAALGWTLLAACLDGERAPGERDLARRLARIEREIHAAPNRARHAMNLALIAIGAARPGLRAAAVAAARRIGKVEVDHGETGCKTPDAATYIAKVVQHREARAQRAGTAAPGKARKTPGKKA